MTTETIPETAVPLEPTTPIKPSEAIRLGCLTTTPHDGAFFDGKGGACALGALIVGLGGGYGGVNLPPLFEDNPDEQTDRYDVVDAALPDKVNHPIGGRPARPSDIIYDLNDSEGWTRERIADWLEGLGL